MSVEEIYVSLVYGYEFIGTGSVCFISFISENQSIFLN